MKTVNNFTSFYSELHNRMLYFDCHTQAKVYRMHLNLVNEAFENPTEKNKDLRIRFCNENNLFINID